VFALFILIFCFFLVDFFFFAFLDFRKAFSFVVSVFS